MSAQPEHDGPGLAFRPEEWEALAVQWPNLTEADRTNYTAQMTRAQRRRLERSVAELHDGKRTFAGKLTTREDVATMLGLYIDRHILPLAADMDLMARDLKEIKRWYDYQRLPWWRRARIAFNVRLVLAQRWLEAKGVRFVKVHEEVADAGDGSGPMPAGLSPLPHPTDGAVGTGAEGDAGGSGGSPGFAAAPSRIEVVPR